jgi:DNA (cytosine-5)-methyltransferase 1
MGRPKLIDLFCGCGGLSLGAARAGFQVVCGIDSDERALATHARNFPGTGHFDFDLATVSGVRILSEMDQTRGEIQVVAGGPPCQGFSPIGKRSIADCRNMLIGHFFRVVKEIRPAAFVMENVPGVLDERFEDLLGAALAQVEKHYVVLQPAVIKATDVGAPTIRTRVFIVGFLKQLRIAPSTDFWAREVSLPAPVVREALSGLPFDVLPAGDDRLKGRRKVVCVGASDFVRSVTEKIPSGVGDVAQLSEYLTKGTVTGCVGSRHSPELINRYGALAYGQRDFKTKSTKLDPNGYCPTLRAGTGSERGAFQAVRPIHFKRPRVITPREAARLQGFPDWYQFDETIWHSFRQIGNSVSPPVAEFVFRKVLPMIS